MKNDIDFPLRLPPETEILTPEGIMQNSQVSDRELAVALYRDFGEEIALAALERFNDGRIARRALLDVLAEALLSRQKYWGAQSLSEWVQGIREHVFRKFERQIDKQEKKLLEAPAQPALDREAFLSGVERAAQKLRRQRKAIQWIPVTTLLVVFIAFVARQLLQVPRPVKMIEVLPVQTSYPRQTATLYYILFWVGAILAMALLSWVLRRHPAGRLYTLFLGLEAIAIFFAWSMRSRYPFITDVYSEILLLSIPAMFIIVLNMYFWINRQRWSRTSWLIAGAATAAFIVIVFNPWIDPSRSNFLWDEYLTNRLPVLLYLLVSLVPLLTWLIFSLQGYWSVITILFAGILEAAILLALPAVYALNVQYDDAINTIVAIGGYLYPLFAGAILGWLICNGFSGVLESRRRRWLRLAGGLLVFIQLSIAIWLFALSISLWESASIFGLFMIFLTLLGLFTGGVASLLRLPGKQKRLSLALLALVLVALIPAGIVPQGASDYVTENRALRIDEAIQRYYATNGVYPDQLEDLSPGYLLLVPRSVTYLTQEWCYVSGGDYYRLGYPYPGSWGLSGETKLRELSGGNLPAGKSPCERQLYEWKLHMW